MNDKMMYDSNNDEKITIFVDYIKLQLLFEKYGY